LKGNKSEEVRFLDVKWSKEANEALSKVPFFVRKRVKRRLEEDAARLKADKVTIEHVHTCRREVK
jgi:anaerobic sulfite reductase subunit C